MKETVLAQIAQIEKMSIKELKVKYIELYGDDALPQSNKMYLFRRIAFKIQEQAYGGLLETAKARIDELITEYDPLSNLGKSKRKKATVEQSSPFQPPRKRSFPLPGTVITKHYKDTVIHVKVLQKGFEYNGKVYNSLSRIACVITGSHLSGFTFFSI
jgi:hypothetical protein